MQSVKESLRYPIQGEEWLWMLMLLLSAKDGDGRTNKWAGVTSRSRLCLVRADFRLIRDHGPPPGSKLRRFTVQDDEE